MKLFARIAAVIAPLALMGGAALPASAGINTNPGVVTSITAQHVNGAGPTGIEITGNLTTAAGVALVGKTVTVKSYSQVLCTVTTTAGGAYTCVVTQQERALSMSKGGVAVSSFAGGGGFAATSAATQV